MNTRLLLAGLAVVAAAGCSSLNETSPTFSPPPPPPIPRTVKSGTDQQVAQAAIMNQQDMGPDYLATPFTPSPQDTADDADFRTCLGQPVTTKDQTIIFSPVFTMDFKVILGNITFADSDKTAHAYIAALRNAPKAVSCLKNSMTAQLGRSGGSGRVEVNQINPPPGGANVDVIAYRLQILAAAEDGQDPQPLVVDLVSALKGRAEISVRFQDLNQPVPTDIQDHAVRMMLDRLPA